MDRNLGANRKATSSTDAQAYGSLYQWGRGSDGHQCVNRYSGDGVTTSATTATVSSSDTPLHGDFITTNSTSNWQSPSNNSLWQGVSGTNNPCPSGYRLPTAAEWDSERLTWSINTDVGAFNSPLKLSKGGRRGWNGLFEGVSGYGSYWTSTINSATSARYLNFSTDSGTSVFTAVKSRGYSVRCIKN
jgi:hypothetical protein